MFYAQLNTTTNYSFLKGASHPQEYVERAIDLGYNALAITDECSLAGVVKAFSATTHAPKHFKLIIGSRFHLSNGMHLIALAPSKQAYAELSGFITLTRRRAPKGEYQAHFDDLRFRLQQCLIIYFSDNTSEPCYENAKQLAKAFGSRLWLGVSVHYAANDQKVLNAWRSLSDELAIPIVACDHAVMHCKERKQLHDVLTAIDENTPIPKMGTRLHANAESYLKPLSKLHKLYPKTWIEETEVLAEHCQFSMNELKYQYPKELVPEPFSPIQYLRFLLDKGKRKRYPEGTPKHVEVLLNKELQLIEELSYEYYFLTVYDIVQFAKSKGILCQGRGSAANSVACYCLEITEISPDQIGVLFERFISKERDEPPDIDVDFEHERREEVIQYIYQKYGRERAALAATVISYRARSAIRDVGKAMGLEPSLVDHLAKSLAWWKRSQDLKNRIVAAGLEQQQNVLIPFFDLVQQILGFPRHLSQHVGGFIITENKISDLVPLENASMADRTVIQWDKDDIETMHLLKVDVLALGMLTALRKALEYVRRYDNNLKSLKDIPQEDPATYDMLCKGDSVGVFQIESRAQMSMLPRLQPRTFYDLVIEIAIVRPGPIQGDMVHPYLRRRNGEEPVSYYNDDIKDVVKRTLGIPIFQEQAIKLSMVAAGFSAGEADALRRAMASWGKNSTLLNFEEKFIQGMRNRGYDENFTSRLFEQIKGFSGYGFPESHSASFAILCYASSWLKCHHPAAFYCALLNSQPMGFYSPSQLVQDARRHQVEVLAVDINLSDYDSKLERVNNSNNLSRQWGIRLGFSRVKSLNREQAQSIEKCRGKRLFKSVSELAQRTQLSNIDLQHLASADALLSICGNRHQARWVTAGIQENTPMFTCSDDNETLVTPEPSLEKNVVTDYATTGLSLRKHPMAILRQQAPFKRCTLYKDLFSLSQGRFVRVAGLVTGRQRPGTANGTIFVTLEDETGNINVIVWKQTQNNFRQALLNAKLLLVKGVIEVSKTAKGEAYDHPVVHVVAGQLIDYSDMLEENFNLKSRDFH